MSDSVRFAVDGMLARLAKYLRALGYDTIHRQSPGEEFFEQAVEEGRVIVTLRKRVPERCGRRIVDPGEASIEAQLKRVIESLRLEPDRDQVFTICLQCNVPTDEVSPEAVASKVPRRVGERISSFRICPACGKIYWWGSHADRMMDVLENSGVFESQD